MKRQEYSIIKSEINGRILNGIKIIDNGAEYIYKYISENEADALRLVVQMKNDYVSPKHFPEIISDFIMLLAYEKLSLMTL